MKKNSAKGQNCGENLTHNQIRKAVKPINPGKQRENKKGKGRKSSYTGNKKLQRTIT